MLAFIAGCVPLAPALAVSAQGTVAVVPTRREFGSALEQLRVVKPAP